MSAKNLWLTSLPQDDQAALEPHLHPKPFERGQMLFDAGEVLDEVWFPLNGVVGLMTVLPEGRLVETGLIGREGVVGVTCGPLNARAATRAVCQIAGIAACMPAEVFAERLSVSEPMRMALARFTEYLMAQVQQTAACNVEHRQEKRLARWLLAMHDRADGERFDLTQADIAGMLGVRRATVSEIASGLEKRGLVERGRGWIRIPDRAGLEAQSCGCYGAIREVMSDLGVPLPNPGKVEAA